MYTGVVKKSMEVKKVQISVINTYNFNRTRKHLYDPGLGSLIRPGTPDKIWDSTYLDRLSSGTGSTVSVIVKIPRNGGVGSDEMKVRGGPRPQEQGNVTNRSEWVGL